MTTLTQPLEISVLSAPIAAIDRRELSQAWYSALGFTRRFDSKSMAALGSGGLRTRGFVLERPTTVVRSPSRAGCAISKLAPRATNRAKRAMDGERSVSERRSKMKPFVQMKPSVQRAVRPQNGAARTTVTIDGERGRVYLMVQWHGERLRIVAVCPKRLAGSVARALEEARFGLCT